MQKISPFLWFDNNAEEAANYYVSVFKNSRIIRVDNLGEGPAGPVVSVTFEINGQEVIALNGGPHYRLNSAFSFFIQCETQEEIDYLWEKLADGGQTQMCGWVTDKYGLTWQVVPVQLREMLMDKDPEKAKRVMDAMLKMIKLDLNILKQAYAQLPA